MDFFYEEINIPVVNLIIMDIKLPKYFMLSEQKMEHSRDKQ